MMDLTKYYLSGKTYETVSEAKQAAIRELKMMENAPADVPIDQSFINEMRRLQAMIAELTDLEKAEETQVNSPETIPNEPHKAFRDKWFSGKDRELLSQGKWKDIDLGDISEHDRDGRVRQGYLAELRGETETAQAIYDSIGFNRVACDPDDLLDTEVEHYG